MSNPNPGNSSESQPAGGGHTRPAPKHWTLTRTMVTGGVALATLFLIVAGLSWGIYRLQHTVVHNAMVKGRVYKVGARIDGQIRSVEVQPGQRVSRDQVIIRLVDDHFQAAARQAEAELDSSREKYDVEKLAIEQQRRQLAVDVQRSESVCVAATGDLEAAKSSQEKWNREYDRITSLIQSGVASRSEMDTVTAQRDNARALVKAAEGHLAAAESDSHLAAVQVDGLKVREAGLAVLAADVELARQRLALANADVAATVIRAPADGWVVDRIVEPGGSAKVGEPMISLWLGAPWVEAWVDEKKLARIKIGSAVDVTLAAFPNHKLRGQVESIGVLTDKEMSESPVPSTLHSLFSDSAMIPIRIAVPEDTVRLQPGLSAFVGISDSTPAANARLAVAPDQAAMLSSVFLGNEPQAELQAQLNLKSK
ncbi:MAG TPA: HlyD family efflux transporter periplasmic adaptor subunit [Dongiaceae bacterium]|nr:HlyD family efflux transporter periplasmic adaptor subunit [Dongiaceae bacterium]